MKYINIMPPKHILFQTGHFTHSCYNSIGIYLYMTLGHIYPSIQSSYPPICPSNQSTSQPASQPAKQLTFKEEVPDTLLNIRNKDLSKVILIKNNTALSFCLHGAPSQILRQKLPNCMTVYTTDKKSAMGEFE